MKKIFLSLVLLLLFFSACGGEVLDLEVKEDVEEEIVEEVAAGSTRDGTFVESVGEVLEDNTGYGFDYVAANVLDQDYSTAWCSSGEGEGPYADTLQILFDESVAGMTVGIVPGFARDEEIFYKNNRVKTLVLSYGGAGAYTTTFEFEDEYEMQFFEMPDVDFDSFLLTVTEVYPGSEYDDTCIAEIDLWSDYVLDEDVEAAEVYYLEHKAGGAITPLNYEDIGFALEEDVSECGLPNALLTSDGGYWHADAGNTPVFVANVTGFAEKGDEFAVKWVVEPLPGLFEDRVFLQGRTVEARECSDGAVYVHDPLDGENQLPAGLFGGFKAELYYQNHIIASGKVNLVQ